MDPVKSLAARQLRLTSPRNERTILVIYRSVLNCRSVVYSVLGSFFVPPVMLRLPIAIYPQRLLLSQTHTTRSVNAADKNYSEC